MQIEKNDYNKIADQIGDLGADNTKENMFNDDDFEINNKNNKSVKKLKYKNSYGQRENLTEEENKDLHDFLNRSKKNNNNISIAEGYLPINKEELGIRAHFYPESWQFYIRPATVGAIKNWTSIDESRMDQMNKVFNDIVKACVKIDTGSDTGAGWAQINSWDRFWFILKIREYTFAQGESKVEFTDECSECGTDIIYTLHSNNLFYEFPDEDIIEKYWNGNTWIIDPKEYNVDHNPVTLYTPKLGKDEAIFEWAAARIQNKKSIDEQFLKMLVWLLPKASKDIQMLDRQIQKIYNDYKSWDLDMYNFMNDVVNNITINQSEQLKCICPSCGMEAVSTVQFPDGIKILFEVKSNVKKFGSR